MTRSLLFCIWITCSLGSLSAADRVATFDEAVQPFLEQHCIRCHGPDKDKGDFRLDTLSQNFRTDEDIHLWVEAMDRMNSGEMPPEDEDQPGLEDIEGVITWLGDRIREGELARMAARPTVAHYRLSREEYSWAVKDLLGVSFDARAPGAFSEDPEWHGFERIGSQLSLSPSHVEKYLGAAATILDMAWPESEPRQLSVRKDALDIDWPNRHRREELEEEGRAQKARTLIWPGHRLTGAGPHHIHSPGIYKVRMQLSGLNPPGGRPPHVSLYSKRYDRMIFEKDVLAPEDEPVIFEFETFLPEGKLDVAIDNEVPGPSNAGRAGRPTGQFVFTTLDDPLSRAPWQRKMTDDAGYPLYPFLIFDWIEWEGPLQREEVVQKREGFFPAESEDPEVLRDALSRFANRAWRRPVTKAEMDRYVKIVTDQLATEVEFQIAFKAGLQGILASKNFYYLAEGAPQKNLAQINDVELASRLSFFLWSSIPDAELLRVAEAGELKKPELLAAQLQRMMEDPKIERFMDAFPQQWLQMSKVGMFPPDPKLYPDYDRWLEKSMVLETTHFFAEVFEKNHSIREFLDSDWTMLNPRLARHYDLPVPEESGFQRVSLSPEDNRGGLLTQASALSLSSDGTRHRPVHRGVWVSEAILGKVPNPPPANVDPIETNPVDEPKATIRMRLEAHTNDASCASCHKHIDPYGFAFDNFDAIGRWRTHEAVEHGQGDDPLVDASGEFPDGRSYDGPAEFKQLLVADVDSFAEAFTTQLATFALRRVMTIDDRDQIAAIAAASESKDYQLRDLIESFVLSDLFLKR